MTSRYVTLLLAAALLTPPDITHAADCLDEIASALRAQAWSRAIEAARAHRARAECATDAELIEFNLATALERADGEPNGQCEARRVYRQLARTASDGDIRQAARVALERLAGACASPDEVATTLSTTDANAGDPVAGEQTLAALTAAPGSSTFSIHDGLLIGALLATVATSATYIGALNADEDRSHARTRVFAARDERTRNRAIAVWEVARDRTDALGYATLSLGTLAVCLGVAAWLVDDDPATTVFVVPGNANVRFSF